MNKSVKCAHSKKEHIYAISCRHYHKNLRQRFLFSRNKHDSLSEYFQHSMRNKNGAISGKYRSMFEQALTLKISGQFYKAQKLLMSMLKNYQGNNSFRAECHYQVGEILQYLYPHSSRYLTHMVACRTLDERHFNAVQAIEGSYITNKRVNVSSGKRILLVIGSNAATVAFANCFVKTVPIAGLIQQYVQFPILSEVFAPAKGKLPFGLSKEESKSFTDEAVLGNQWNALFLKNNIPNIFIARGEANKQYVLNWVKGLKPDLIVSHGPERLDKRFIALARYGGINVHWGISPTYRGMDTARWPLFQKKPEWVGVTVHKLDEKLDTGPILYQAKPRLCVGHTCRMIEYSLTMLACEIVPRAVQEVFSGKCNAVPQEKNKGTQYWARQWTQKHRNILNKKYISEQIRLYHKYKEDRDMAAPLINPWSSFEIGENSND